MTIKFKVTHERKRAGRVDNKTWEILVDGEKKGEIRFRRDWVKAKQTDRIRTKMASIYDLCLNNHSGSCYGLRSLKDAKEIAIERLRSSMSLLISR